MGSKHAPMNTCIGDQENNVSGGSPDRSKSKKSEKLVSSILSKPDEVDIVKVVKYPHELLDMRHVRGEDRLFKKLNFELFCTGELEIIRRPGIKLEEHEARLSILNTLCYHSKYVTVEELKSQYDATMKSIERGVAQWSNKLAEKLHSDLAFRASVINHDRLITNDSDKFRNERKNEKSKKVADKAKIKVYYCSDFNNESCIHSDHHNGRLGSCEVCLWHICRRCYNSEGKPKKSHPETDPNCPSRT